MRRMGAGSVSAVIMAGLLVAACSGTPGATGGSSGGGGGDLSTVDACSLLSPAEIEQALGVTDFGAGQNQDSDIVKQCEWDEQGDNPLLTVGVTVRTFTAEDWQTVQAFPNAVAVSGMGDAAYRNSPLTGDLSVKHDGYEIDMGIVNFSTKPQAEIDQATDSLMQLILSRT
jgi:hypothetical protein